jgi:hypothetical protein
MRVYVLRLDGKPNLQRAFAMISNAPDVATCTVEAQIRQVRFLAPADKADALVQRVYLDGGLLWCSRHDARLAPISD